ncbi:MAG TPA: hypothetical protein VIL42_10600 [Sphingomicrobium sp.]|jgi:hypothetical protein
MLKWQEVEEELVQAVRFYWRSGQRAAAAPNGRPGGFATDAPWQLMTREGRADGAALQVWQQEREAEAVREMRNRPQDLPLTAEQVTWMEGRLSWLLLVGDADRKLVELAVKAKAGGAGRVDWARIRAKLPIEIGRVGLYRRYVRALQGVAKALDRSQCAWAA